MNQVDLNWPEKYIKSYQGYQRVLQKAAQDEALTDDEKRQLYKIMGKFDAEIERLRGKQ